tara:strand:+ start:3837 stop:4229 length:393 start_codon:yes stop_codon:yes gene_type:complete
MKLWVFEIFPRKGKQTVSSGRFNMWNKRKCSLVERSMTGFKATFVCIGFGLIGSLAGCSLPIAMDTDALGVSGGIVDAPVDTQRANSAFKREVELPQSTTKADGQEVMTTESDSAEIGSSIAPNFRPLIP